MVDLTHGALTTVARSVHWVELRANTLATSERRLDAETYLSDGFLLRETIRRSNIVVSDFNHLADAWLPSRLKAVLVAPGSGVRYLVASQLFDIRPVPRKWLAPRHTPDMAKRFVESGRILVTRSGSVGESIVTFSAHLGAVISDDLLRVDPKNLTDSGFLYAFLRSRLGRGMLRSSRYGSIVKHLEPEHLEEVPVPVPSDELKAQLGVGLGRIVDLRSNADRLVSNAEVTFVDGIGQPVPEYSDESGFIISAVDTFTSRRRLDGYHHNPRARAAAAALTVCGHPLEPLGSVVGRIFGVPRFKHVYQSKGIPYLDSEDIFKVNPEITKFIPAVTKRDADGYFVKSGWLLMACSGQIYGLNGSVALANANHENKVISNHILRICPSTAEGAPRQGYLHMVLSHPIYGRPLVLRLAFGTEVPEIDPSDLVHFPVVRLEAEIEDKIASDVERACDFRSEAARIEDEMVKSYENEVLKNIGDLPLDIWPVDSSNVDGDQDDSE